MSLEDEAMALDDVEWEEDLGTGFELVLGFEAKISSILAAVSGAGAVLRACADFFAIVLENYRLGRPR